MVYTDMAWTGLMLGIIAFKAVPFKEEPNLKLMLLKNVIFLGLVYSVIALHYATRTFMVSLGITLILFYVLNLLANSN